MTPVPFVGLTGGVGAGKSTALQALERLGAETLSTDEVVHALYASDEVRDAVVERFGPSVAPDASGVPVPPAHAETSRTAAQASKPATGR